MARPRKYQTEEERKAAHNESQRKYAEANPDKVKESIRKYVEANPDKVKESKRKWAEANPDYMKEWREANPDKVKEEQMKYVEANPEMARALSLVNAYKRNDKMYNRGECTITGKWIVDNIFTSKCHYCQKDDWTELGCDRIYNSLPHTPENVVCCCEECNTKRGRKSFQDFCKEMGVTIASEAIF